MLKLVRSTDNMTARGDSSTMKLVRLEIQSFRAFAHATVEFPESGVLLLAGANNSGKSALLSALDSIALGASSGELQHYGSMSPPQATASFRLSDHERDNLLKNTNDHSLRQSKAFREVRWDFETIGAGLAPVRLMTEWPRQEILTLAEVVSDSRQASLRVSPTRAVLKGVEDWNPAFEPEEVRSWLPPEGGNLRTHVTDLDAFDL